MIKSINAIKVGIPAIMLASGITIATLQNKKNDLSSESTLEYMDKNPISQGAKAGILTILGLGSIRKKADELGISVKKLKELREMHKGGTGTNLIDLPSLVDDSEESAEVIKNDIEIIKKNVNSLKEFLGVHIFKEDEEKELNKLLDLVTNKLNKNEKLDETLLENIDNYVMIYYRRYQNAFYN